jgi:hypothetical protein
VDTLAAGDPLPEARVVRKAREFADSLRRGRGALATGGVQPPSVSGGRPENEAQPVGDVAVADSEQETGR